MSFQPVNKLEKTEENKEDEYKRVADAIDSLQVKVKESQVDPEFIRKHPPVKEYMAVELKKAELRSVTPDMTEITEDALIMPLDAKEPLPEGDYIMVDRKTQKEHKVAIYDTVFRTDLRTLVNAQFYECPATVFPVIAERLEQTARSEHELKFPDKRSDKKDYFWLYFFILMMVLIVVAFTVL